MLGKRPTPIRSPTPPPRRTRGHSGRSGLDWLFDLLEEAALADPKKLDPYVAAVGVTILYEDLINATGNGLSSQGSTLTGEAVRRLACDADIHRIVVKGQSEILDYGRGERLFNRLLRRALRFRHGHVCGVRGCGRRITQIHHIDWWENDGETSIDNGIPLCSYHHHLVHEGGWNIAWNPTTGTVTLEGPRGQTLQTTASFLRAA
ncbi:MAG TPA: HNH endonuclease signature motif containing protein [Acidimicrobiales bacterium]|nr:HNH endonuclease signature motif containing protein [Acidimicrobiales bacterium]